ncbi:MAG: hypothetical protein IPJ19_18500 [Planctomycetes bacterium]|nr:hypothetical protein [Planctomycetota bacterium]
MAEFDERWRKLVSAARAAEEPFSGLSPQRIAELARGRRSESPYARLERRSLVALAVLCACALLAIVPCRDRLSGLIDGARADLAALPARIPRPPQAPPASLALETLPDLHSLLALTPFSLENHP